jgi:lipocalin
MSESLDASRKGLAVEALTAKLQAVTLQAKADLAKTAAKSAAAAVAPASRPQLKVSGDMTRSARREVARIAATFSPATVGNFSDNYVTDLARHPSTSPADREVAKAQLTRRGITLYANGNTARSTRKA